MNDLNLNLITILALGVAGVAIFAFFLHRAERPLPPSDKDAKDGSQQITDLIKCSWDTREKIRSATSRAEIEACSYEIDFIGDTFQGLVPDGTLADTLTRLRAYLDTRRASKQFNR